MISSLQIHPFFANTTFSIRTYIKHINVGYAGLILRGVKISLDVVISYHNQYKSKLQLWYYHSCGSILMYEVHKQRDIPADSMLLSLSFDIGCCLLCCMVVWFSDCLSSLPPYPTKQRYAQWTNPHIALTPSCDLALKSVCWHSSMFVCFFNITCLLLVVTERR